MSGKFFFFDVCRLRIDLVDANNAVTFSASYSDKGFTTFGEDKNGELYVADYNNGEIFKIGDNSVGLNKMKTPVQFSLSPNPANQSLTITSEGETMLNEIRIYDLSGQLCIIQNENRILKATIDVSTLQYGIYNLQIRNNFGELRNYKLVVE